MRRTTWTIGVLLLGRGVRDMNLANAGAPIFQDLADNDTSTHVLVELP